jgi:hypothetical protein
VKELETSTLVETAIAFFGLVAVSGLTAVYLLLKIHQTYYEFSPLVT